MIPPPAGPRLEWSLDLLVDLPSSRGYVHVLTCVDVFSKYTIFIPLPDRASRTVATAFRSHVLGVFGVPLYLRCDNGAEFKGDFSHMAAVHEIQIRRCSPYHSNANGQAERAHLTLTRLLRKALLGVPETAWSTLLPELQLAINATLSKAINVPPYLVMFGAPPTPLVRCLRSPVPPPDSSSAAVTRYTAAV